MAFHYSPPDKPHSTINPADLHSYSADQSFFSESSVFDSYGAPTNSAGTLLADLSTVDSAVDLTSFQTHQWSPQVKLEHTEPSMDHLLDLAESSAVSNTPSPQTDMIFSNANSPGDFVRDFSQTSSPETTNDAIAEDVKPTFNDDSWKSMFATPDVIHIPQTVEKPLITLLPDKTKTRAETQIKVQLVLDPLEDRFEHIHFPRKTLAKPKLLASAEERKEIDGRGGAIHMDMFLVCATAVDTPDRMEQALKRARGDERIPRRQAGVAISELEKDDPAHPQNGGEVLICDGCKERERKRYDRKKKRAEDEEEWWQYEDDRVIMINEKEYKKFKDIDSSDHSPRAKQVEFAMRIACYCRHQEEKSPVGYRVIFTFKDSSENFITQHTSEIFQITDDHKNKEVPPEQLPQPLNIPTAYVSAQSFAPNANVVPIYQYPAENQYSQATSMAAYSQPPTPIMTNFQAPISPTDVAQFSAPPTPNGLPRHSQSAFFSSTTQAHFPRPQPSPQSQNPYDIPLLSPSTQVSPDVSYLTRPVSMDNFSFATNFSYPQYHAFASAPPSAGGTPINLSRPASPTWEQGRPKKKMHCVCFYVEGEEE